MKSRLKRFVTDVFRLIILIGVIALAIFVVLSQPELSWRIQAALWSPAVREDIRVMRGPILFTGFCLVVWTTSSVLHRHIMSIIKAVLVWVFLLLILPRVLDLSDFWFSPTELVIGWLGALVLGFILLDDGKSSNTADSGGWISSGAPAGPDPNAVGNANVAQKADNYTNPGR